MRDFEVIVHNLSEILNEVFTSSLVLTYLLDPGYCINFTFNISGLFNFVFVIVSVTNNLKFEPTVIAHSFLAITFDVVYHKVNYFV